MPLDGGPPRDAGRAPRSGSARSAWQRSDRTRRRVLASVLVLDAVMLASVLAHLGGPLRETLGLLTVAVVPGTAIVGLMRLKDAVLEFALTLAIGPAALVLIAQLVSSLGVWHLFAVEVAVLVACAPSLCWQLARPANRAQRR